MDTNNKVKLESVGTLIDKETLNTYAMLKNGGYDEESEMHVDDCCEEWHNALSKKDKEIIKNLKNETANIN